MAVAEVLTAGPGLHETDEHHAHGVLGNGLWVKMKKQPFQRTLNLGLFIGHGSCHETPESNGIAHFIEHVLFNPRHMAPPAAVLLDRLVDDGAGYEAFTSKDYTRFGITCLPRDMDLALELMARLLADVRITPEAVEHERAIILQEHAMAFSSPRGILNQLLDHTFWGDRSLGLFILGRKENIARFQPEEIGECIRHHFVPQRCRLVVVSPADFSQVFAAAEEAFAPWDGHLGPIAEPEVVTAPGVLPLPATSRRADLLFGYLAGPFDSPDRHAVELLADILGGGLKSRLFLHLREQSKLAYLTLAYPLYYRLGGYLALRINCDLDDALAVGAGIDEELRQLREDGVEKVELRRAKGARTMALLDVLENNHKYLDLLGRRAIQGQDFNAGDELRGVDSIHEEDLRRVAREILVPEREAIVGFGVDREVLGELRQC